MPFFFVSQSPVVLDCSSHSLMLTR